MKWLLPDAVFHAGIYAKSFRLLDAAAMFAMLFAGLLLPMFSRIISAGADVRPLARLAMLMLALISITVALAALLYGDEIMAALYPNGTEKENLLSVHVFKNIMMTFVPMSVTFVFSTLLTSARDIFYMNIFALATFVCNFTINYLLIPQYGSFGASIASLCTQSVFALLCLWRCFSLYKFIIPWKDLGRLTVLIISLTGFYYLTSAVGNIWIKLMLFASASAIFSVLLKLVEISKIGRLFDKTPQ